MPLNHMSAPQFQLVATAEASAVVQAVGSTAAIPEPARSLRRRMPSAAQAGGGHWRAKDCEHVALGGALQRQDQKDP